METPYKQNAVFRFGSPSNDITKVNPATPDILKFLPPSLLILSAQKDNEYMSPILGTSVFKSEPDDQLSTPTEAMSRRSTRRRLLSDAEQTSMKSNENDSNDDVFLHRLQSNPMFGELSKILAEECLHMQTPTNLINVTWDATSSYNKPTRNVHASHLKLQKKFLQFRSQERLQVSALEIESQYSREVSKMEIDRYVELSLTMSQEHASFVHEKFDNLRLQLVNQANNNLDELLLKLNTQEKRNETTCRRRLRNSVSPVSDTQYDSGLSSDDNSMDYPVKSEQQVDVLKLAMAAADVLPVPDTPQHNFNQTFSDITSLLETFPVPRQEVMHCQPPTQMPVQQPETLKPRPTLKRKLENTDDQFTNMGNQTKKPRSENTTPKPRQITPEATRILSEWYDNHVQYPYPTDEDVSVLVLMTSLSSPQVKKWMANKRVRCFNTLSITGNKHPIKSKLAGKKKPTDNGNTYKQLNDQSKKILGDWYELHAEHPYPSETEKKQLASAAGITLTQVKSWFANRRSRASNRRRQVPNYFLEKFPEYTPHVQMVQVHRDQTRRRIRPQPEIQTFSQNCYF